MKNTTALLLSAGLALLAVVDARAQATLYGIGDLAGGKIYSQVNDATKVGGVIYAVGGSTATSATNNNDRAVLWASSSPGTLTAIPDFVNNTVGTGGVIASAITPDGTAIAARLHNHATNGNTMAALVTNSGGTTTSLGTLNGTTSNASAISDSGTILFGSAQYSGNPALTQIVRYTNSASSISAVPFVTLAGSVQATNMFTPGQAALSADGDRLVGSANTGGGFNTAGTQAFLYIHTGTDLSADVPFRSGGTWTAGLAINAAGTLGLMAGNSSSYTNGEVFLFNDTTDTSLGSPNSAFSFAGGGSMNADGSLVTATFSNAGTPLGYIHNASGWLQLDSVATTLGANMTGWSNLNIFGMSPDGTLVWGNGNHSGNTEGFVLEFSAGALTAIPEPSTYAASAAFVALAFAVWRRSRNHASDHLCPRAK